MLIRRFEARETRFSSRVLRSYAATGLAETLAVRAADAGAVTEILLYDEIGYWGVTAKDFVLALAAAGDGPINLRINSPGGDTFDGLAIYNALRARVTPVTVTVDGIAASAASLIAMAGGAIQMPEQAMLMIHNCWGFCIGNRNDMREMANVQEKIDGQMAAIYATRSGKAAADMSAAMDAETWYTSTEAKAAGLCDTIIEAQQGGAQAALRPVLRSGRRFAAYGAPQPRALSLPPYDPDGDGDNDAEEALSLIGSAMVLLDEAAGALTGTDDPDDDDGATANDAGMPLVPGAQMRRRRPRAAATTPEWVVGADEGLPIDTSDTWDGPAAAERMLDAAGFNGNSPDPAMAKRGFLAWDHHNPNLKGSYKLPFADLVDGELRAVKGGIDAAASRLPQSDLPQDVQDRARAVLDGYEKRMAPPADDAKATRMRRLRLAEAELTI